MDDLIKILQKIESLVQMQYDSKEYLENGYSVFPYNYISKDTKVFIVNSKSDFDVIDNLDVDVEGLDLCDVILTLHAQGLLKDSEVRLLSKQGDFCG